MRYVSGSVVLYGLLFITSCNSGGGGGAFDGPTCETATIETGSNCGCHFQAPVDLSQLNPTYGIWAFGVHGGGHPEGHPGWDFQPAGTSDRVISMPEDGHISKIETDTSDEHLPGVSVTVKLDCGIVVVFIPMDLDSGIQVGSQFQKGDRIGTINASWGSVHFGTAAKDADPRKSYVCPENFFSGGELIQLDDVLANSTYQEKSARNVNITCKDASTLNINLPAEPDLCAAHLDDVSRAQIEACVQPPYLQVW